MRGLIDVRELVAERVKSRLGAHLRAQADDGDPATFTPESARDAEREERERAERADAARRGMAELKARRAKEQDQ